MSLTEETFSSLDASKYANMKMFKKVDCPKVCLANQKFLKIGSTDINVSKDEEKFPNGPWCKATDWVLITKYAGSRIRIDGGELRIVNDDEILAVIDHPKDILPASLF